MTPRPSPNTLAAREESPPPSYSEIVHLPHQHHQLSVSDGDLSPDESMDSPVRWGEQIFKISSFKDYSMKKQHFFLGLLAMIIIAALAITTLFIYKMKLSQSEQIVASKYGTFRSKCTAFHPVGRTNLVNATGAVTTTTGSGPGTSSVTATATSAQELKCDLEQNLQCDENDLTCECMTGMYFNRTLATCLSFAGERCSNYKNHKPCTPHATCYQENRSADGWCHCEPDYAQVSDGLCLLEYEKFGCVETKDCNHFRFLKCSESGQCICDSKNSQRWDNVKKLCATLVGGPCILSKQCANNATCSHTCTCNANYKETPSRTCGLDYNQQCVHSSDCHPSFDCRSSGVNEKKFCRCRREEIYQNGQCVAKAGSPCWLGINQCDGNAECSRDGEHSALGGVCRCVVGHSQTSTKSCLADHGAHCEFDAFCNAEAGLVCSTRSRCECQEGLVYRARKKTCGYSGASSALSGHLPAPLRRLRTTSVLSLPFLNLVGLFLYSWFSLFC